MLKSVSEVLVSSFEVVVKHVLPTDVKLVGNLLSFRISENKETNNVEIA